MENELIISTWNLRTLRRSGASKELRDVITSYGADVIALQEIRWKGSAVLSGKKDEVDLYYSWKQNRHKRLVSEKSFSETYYWMDPGE